MPQPAKPIDKIEDGKIEELAKQAMANKLKEVSDVMRKQIATKIKTMVDKQSK